MLEWTHPDSGPVNSHMTHGMTQEQVLSCPVDLWKCGTAAIEWLALHKGRTGYANEGKNHTEKALPCTIP